MTTVGPFEIHELLGAGGMGRVYRARHVELGVDVALKALAPNLLNPEARDALRAEVEATCDYVGPDFAREARARFAEPPAGPDTAPKGIYGEASLAQAAELVADGIPVAPLPFRPRRLADA